MNSTLQFTVSRKHLILILLLILAVTVGLTVYSGREPAESREPGDLTFTEVGPAKKDIPLSEFDPNELDASQWMALGFSDKQTATILKYKQVVGGAFTSKEQFKKCYAVSDSRFEELEPYLLLPEKEKSTYRTSAYSYRHVSTFSPAKKTLSIPGKFNPDTYSQRDWEKLGFSERQAAAILKYRSYLGGSFISKEKFRDCFIISDDNYRKLEPYLLLPSTAVTAPVANASGKSFARSENKVSQAKISVFDPNLLDLQGWIGLGFSEKQANVIMNYRNRILKGSFRSKGDIKNCFVISEQKFAELEPFINLNPENIGKRNSSAASQGQISGPVTDFTKVDLNEITAEQLVEFGFDERAARNYVSFRKKLGGFAVKNQVFESYDIDRELAQKLIDISPLNLSKVERYTLIEAPESWLKTHPYFRYSADKIIYYRLSNSDEKKIWKLVNAKPEYQAKMKLYLK